MKIWTCGSSPRSGSRNAWKRIKNVNGASRLNNFWNFFGAIEMISCRARLVTMDETWLYHYDPETKQQPMEWRHSGSPRPQKFRMQNSAGKFLGSVFWYQEDIIFIDYLPKGPTINAEYCSFLLVQLKDILKENAAGRSPRGSCSSTTMLRLTGHLHPRRVWPTRASSFLITHPLLRIWIHRTTTCSLDWKTIARSPFSFRRGGRCCRGDLVGQTTFWFFFWVTCKS